MAYQALRQKVGVMDMSRRIGLTALLSVVLAVFAPGAASALQGDQPEYCYETSPPDVGEDGDSDSGGLMPPDTLPADSAEGDESFSSSAAGDAFCPPSIESVPETGRPVAGAGGADGTAALPTRIDAGAGALASTGTSVMSLVTGAGALLAGGGALLAGAGAGLRRRRRR